MHRRTLFDPTVKEPASLCLAKLLTSSSKFRSPTLLNLADFSARHVSTFQLAETQSGLRMHENCTWDIVGGVWDLIASVPDRCPLQFLYASFINNAGS